MKKKITPKNTLKKRACSAVLASMMLLSGLTGCGADSGKTPDQTPSADSSAAGSDAQQGTGSSAQEPAASQNTSPTRPDTLDTITVVLFGEESPRMQELMENEFQQGLIPKDILTNTVTLPFQANMASFMRGTCGTTLIENEPGLQTVVPEAKTAEYYIAPEKPIYKKTYENTAFQVPVTSEKADRVAMFVNLLQKNTEMANLFAYGVEGTDYELIDGKVSKLNTEELFYEWMIYNVKISSPTMAYTDEFMEVYKAWDDKALPSLSFGFSIDYSAIQTQKAQIDSLWEELANPMLAGLKDFDSSIDELRSEMQKAGWDAYMAEIQRQFDEFLADKNA